MTNSPLTTPIVGSLRDLESRLGVKRDGLRELLKSRPVLYHPYTIPKKQHPYPGKERRKKAQTEQTKYRQIDNPARQLKDIQSRILRQILSKAELPSYMFGAVAGKTLVLHAQQHVKNQTATVVRMDISSYYPNITCFHVYYVWRDVLGCPPRIAKLLTELTTCNWHLPQGAPTSPAIANIFLASIYAPVCLASEQKGLTITTWVDDLIFSGNAARDVMETVRQVLAQNGFKMAPKKREILGPKTEKVITGIRLGGNQVRAPHRKMSELRASIHRLAIGLVPSAELDRYCRNLASRIAHVRSVCKDDGERLISLAKRKGVKL